MMNLKNRHIIWIPIKASSNDFQLIGILLVVFGFYGNTAHTQDAIFSQFYANPLYLNPALAGTGECSRVMFNYRNQWPSLQGNFVTYSASADHYVNALAGGIGLIFTSDNAAKGLKNTTRLSALYAYHLKINYNVNLNAGFEATFHQEKLKTGELIFRDMIDPVTGEINPGNTGEMTIDNKTVTVPDFAVGLTLGIKERYFIGIAADHLAEPALNYYVNSEDNILYRKYTIHGGARINLNGMDYGGNASDFYLEPNILYQQQQNTKQLNVGTYIQKSPLILGIWYRHNFDNPDGFIFLAGITQKRFKFGYSYDLTLSKLKGATGGAHEVSLAILFNCNKKRNRPGAIKCPEF